MFGYKQIGGIEVHQDVCCNPGTQAIESKDRGFTNKKVVLASEAPRILSADEDTP